MAVGNMLSLSQIHTQDFCIIWQPGSCLDTLVIMSLPGDLFPFHGQAELTMGFIDLLLDQDLCLFHC